MPGRGGIREAAPRIDFDDAENGRAPATSARPGTRPARSVSLSWAALLHSPSPPSRFALERHHSNLPRPFPG